MEKGDAEMLELKMKVNDDEHAELLEAIHKALQGSPSYISSEVLLNGDNQGEIILVVGNDNMNDLTVDVEVSR